MLGVLSSIIVVVVSGQAELLHPLSAHSLTANSGLDTGDSISQPVPVLGSPASPVRPDSTSRSAQQTGHHNNTDTPVPAEVVVLVVVMLEEVVVVFVSKTMLVRLATSPD